MNPFKKVRTFYKETVSDLGEDIKEVVIQLSAGSQGAYEPIWLPAEFKPARHYGYAVQWFGLALVLAGSYIYFEAAADTDSMALKMMIRTTGGTIAVTTANN